MKRTVISVCLLASLFSHVAGADNIYRKGWIDFNKNGVKDVYEDPSAEIEKRVADLLGQTKTVSFTILHEDMEILDANYRWVVIEF